MEISFLQTVDADKSGKISAMELRQALLNNNWSHFNPETCRLLISMFDSNNDGNIDLSEFAALWKYVQEWKSCFDRSVVFLPSSCPPPPPPHLSVCPSLLPFLLNCSCPPTL